MAIKFEKEFHLVLDRFYYGVCYYPEAWEPDRFKIDIPRIAAAGFNYVRMGEGAWSYWEPREGEYQFDLFDRTIDLCRKHKLKVILGTPTYAGPAWIATSYPQVLRWNFNRIPMQHGSRRFYNYTSPKFLELSDRIVTALAEHYQGNPTVFAWQLDNEFNCHMDVSYSPSDTLAFRAWLRRKYKTLDRLNQAWGTKFWSQTYGDWEQIDLPHPTATYHNPTQLLDESRFISDTVVDFAKRQAGILRGLNQRWLITHNGLFNNVDGPKLAKQLDFFSHDQYPLFSNEGDWPSYAQPLAQARSLSFPYGILEQQSGPGGQMDYLHRTPRPGEMRLWAWQSIAHGAKLLGFFRWRTCPYGQEQHWHGLLDADDRDNRRLVEARQLGKELKKLPAEFFDASPVKSVALLRDYDNEINDRRINTYNRSADGEIGRWYAALSRAHIPVDMVWPDSALGDYGTLIVGHLKMVDGPLVKKLTAFVRTGGTLIMSAQSGLKDRNCHIVEQTPPGPLRALAGVEVVDWTTLPQGQSRFVHPDVGGTLEMIAFVENLKLVRAKPLATWIDDDPLLSNSPAITRNRVGKGQVIYIGGYAPSTTITELIPLLLDEQPLKAPPQVEIIVRKSSRRRFTILMNHSGSEQTVTQLPIGRELLSGKRIEGTLMLPPFGVAIVESQDKAT